MADKKISDLTASLLARFGDRFEITQGGNSRSILLEKLPIEYGLIPPTTANAMDDEFIDPATLPGGGSPLWAWVNQTTSTASIGSGKLQIVGPAVNGQSVHALEQTLPATPWEFYTKVTLNGPWGNSHVLAGLFLRDSASNKCQTFSIGFSGTHRLRVENWNTPTSDNGAAYTKDYVGIYVLYFRIKNDGTNRYYYVSFDAINWYPVFQQSQTTFLTANRIGLMWYYENIAETLLVNFDFFRRLA